LQQPRHRPRSPGKRGARQEYERAIRDYKTRALAAVDGGLSNTCVRLSWAYNSLATLLGERATV
jgi:hypothetical protein